MSQGRMVLSLAQRLASGPAARAVRKRFHPSFAACSRAPLRATELLQRYCILVFADLTVQLMCTFQDNRVSEMLVNRPNTVKGAQMPPARPRVHSAHPGHPGWTGQRTAGGAGVSSPQQYLKFSASLRGVYSRYSQSQGVISGELKPESWEVVVRSGSNVTAIFGVDHKVGHLSPRALAFSA